MRTEDDADLNAGKGRSPGLAAALASAIGLGLFLGWVIWTAFAR